MNKLRTIKIVGTVILSVLAMYMLLFDHTFKGMVVPYDFIQDCEIAVDGNQVNIRGEFMNKDWKVQDIKYTERNGVVRVEVIQGPRSPYNSNRFDEELTITSGGKAITHEITEVWIEDKIAWDQGVFICKETSKLYNENFSSAKDELGFARLVIASGVDATIGEYDLTFDEETPNELIITTNMKFSSDIKSDVENKLMKYTCVLIGAAEQLEKVTYNYFIDDEVETLTINEADVERFAGVSVKEQFKSPKDLQEMLYSIEFIES